MIPCAVSHDLRRHDAEMCRLQELEEMSGWLVREALEGEVSPWARNGALFWDAVSGMSDEATAALLDALERGEHAKAGRMLVDMAMAYCRAEAERHVAERICK